MAVGCGVLPADSSASPRRGPRASPRVSAARPFAAAPGRLRVAARARRRTPARVSGVRRRCRSARTRRPCGPPVRRGRGRRPSSRRTRLRRMFASDDSSPSASAVSSDSTSRAAPRRARRRTEPLAELEHDARVDRRRNARLELERAFGRGRSKPSPSNRSARTRAANASETSAGSGSRKALEQRQRLTRRGRRVGGRRCPPTSQSTRDTAARSRDRSVAQRLLGERDRRGLSCPPVLDIREHEKRAHPQIRGANVVRNDSERVGRELAGESRCSASSRRRSTVPDRPPKQPQRETRSSAAASGAPRSRASRAAAGAAPAASSGPSAASARCRARSSGSRARSATARCASRSGRRCGGVHRRREERVDEMDPSVRLDAQESGLLGRHELGRIDRLRVGSGQGRGAQQRVARIGRKGLDPCADERVEALWNGNRSRCRPCRDARVRARSRSRRADCRPPRARSGRVSVAGTRVRAPG